jgi:hypothetical protein
MMGDKQVCIIVPPPVSAVDEMVTNKSMGKGRMMLKGEFGVIFSSIMIDEFCNAFVGVLINKLSGVCEIEILG